MTRLEFALTCAVVGALGAGLATALLVVIAEIGK
jgi:hypothetical protein